MKKRAFNKRRGQDLVSVVHSRKGPYCIGVFLKENVRILSGHSELSVIKRCL